MRPTYSLLAHSSAMSCLHEQPESSTAGAKCTAQRSTRHTSLTMLTPRAGLRAGRLHTPAAPQVSPAPDADVIDAAASGDRTDVKRQRSAWGRNDETRARQVQNEAQKRYRCAAADFGFVVRCSVPAQAPASRRSGVWDHFLGCVRKILQGGALGVMKPGGRVANKQLIRLPCNAECDTGGYL